MPVGATVLALLQNARALLPTLQTLSLRDMASLPALVPLLTPQDVEKLSKHAPRLAAHAGELLPRLPALARHFPLIMARIDLLVPKLDRLAPLLPRLTASRDTTECLPYLLEPRVCAVLLENLDDLEGEQLASRLRAASSWFLTLLLAGRVVGSAAIGGAVFGADG